MSLSDEIRGPANRIIPPSPSNPIPEKSATDQGSAGAGEAIAAGSPRGRWRKRPAPRWVMAALAGIIVVIPAWMLRDDLRNFALFGDDFVYVAEARDWPRTASHLWEPHNTHVVPLFRLWTFVLVALAGRLEYLPAFLSAAAYLGLVAAMLAVGHLVARETGRLAAGLAAMAFLGISTVTYPAVTWYSAGQALWAGTAIVATVAMARNWSARRGAARLAAVALGAVLAPAIWSGGLVAGPAAMAYVCARKRSGVRGFVLLLAGTTLIAGLLILALSTHDFDVNGVIWERRRELWPRPIQALMHTAQALVEVCAFGNLGVDAITTPWQAVALLVALAALYAWSHTGLGTISPLEVTGATIALCSCLLVYTLRGNLPYSSLRTLGWYCTIPQIGVILFAAGWWTALTAPQPGRMNHGEAAGLLGLVIVFCLIQVPRRAQQLIQAAPAFLSNESLSFPTTELRLARARYYKAEHHARQVRALARLDRVDRILSRAGASPEILRHIMGRVLIPGIPAEQLNSDAFSLLTPRSQTANALAAVAAHRSDLIELLTPEPPPARAWLDPRDPLWRAVREVSADRPETGERSP